MPVFLGDAPEQREGFELIPDGTFVRLRMTIVDGGETIPNFENADALLFTAGKAHRETGAHSDVRYMNCEFTVVAGPHARTKIRFINLTVAGGAVDDKGISKGWLITKQTLRAITESALGISAKDVSQAAMARRTVPCFRFFHGQEFAARMGVQAGDAAPDGRPYPDKNFIAHVVTPDEPEWQPTMEGRDVPPKPTGVRKARSSGTAATPATAAAPAWNTPPGTAGAQPWAQPQPPVPAAAPQYQPPPVQPAGQPAQPAQPATAPAGGPNWLSRPPQ